MIKDPKLDRGGAYLITWNPKRWEMDLTRRISRFKKDPSLIDQWNVGRTRLMQPGTPFFFLRQGRFAPGLIGWGVIRSQVFEGEHWDEGRSRNGKLARYVKLQFMALSESDDRPLLDRASLLSDRGTRHFNWDSQSSGVRIPGTVVGALKRMLRANGARVATIREQPALRQLLVGDFIEAAEKQFVTTRRERSGPARELCVQHFGCRCAACNFDFGEFYGPKADGFIEVHHRKLLSKAKGPRRVNHRHDLVPLCANCHRVAHLSRTRVLTVRAIQGMISAARCR
jgi:5-methylcytosine-specific restriction protein A